VTEHRLTLPWVAPTGVAARLTALVMSLGSAFSVRTRHVAADGDPEGSRRSRALPCGPHPHAIERLSVSSRIEVLSRI
jgi:hypothetical protein